MSGLDKSLAVAVEKIREANASGSLTSEEIAAIQEGLAKLQMLLSLAAGVPDFIE